MFKQKIVLSIKKIFVFKISNIFEKDSEQKTTPKHEFPIRIPKFPVSTIILKK